MDASDALDTMIEKKTMRNYVIAAYLVFWMMVLGICGTARGGRCMESNRSKRGNFFHPECSKVDPLADVFVFVCLGVKELVWRTRER